LPFYFGYNGVAEEAISQCEKKCAAHRHLFIKLSCDNDTFFSTGSHKIQIMLWSLGVTNTFVNDLECRWVFTGI